MRYFRNKLKEYLNQKMPFLDELKNNEKENKDYYNKLDENLLTLYFQCQLSVPSIEIDFKKENNFKGDRMIDYSGVVGKKKVNFVIFPSLKSKGRFIKNGKQHVFAYIDDQTKKTFLIEETELNSIINMENKFSLPEIKDKLILKIKKCFSPKLNYKLSKNVKREYKYYIKDKINKLQRTETSYFLVEIKENEELIKCEFYLMSQHITTYSKEEKNKILIKYSL